MESLSQLMQAKLDGKDQSNANTIHEVYGECAEGVSLEAIQRACAHSGGEKPEKLARSLAVIHFVLGGQLHELGFSQSQGVSIMASLELIMKQVVVQGGMMKEMDVLEPAEKSLFLGAAFHYDS